MSKSRVTVKEEDILRMILDYLSTQGNYMSMRTLEKQTGIVNCPYSEELILLRELVLEGDWDEVLLFLHPFEKISSFNYSRACYLSLRQKYLEMIDARSHLAGKASQGSIEDVVRTLGAIEKHASPNDDYTSLCWLLTRNSLQESAPHADWNVDTYRKQCFDNLAALFVAADPKELGFKASQDRNAARAGRLLQLISKGIFYETCVDVCQSVAAGEISTAKQYQFHYSVLHGAQDGCNSSLVSWIQSLDSDSFLKPFEQTLIDFHHEPRVPGTKSPLVAPAAKPVDEALSESASRAQLLQKLEESHAQRAQIIASLKASPGVDCEAASVSTSVPDEEPPRLTSFRSAPKSVIPSKENPTMIASTPTQAPHVSSSESQRPRSQQKLTAKLSMGVLMAVAAPPAPETRQRQGSLSSAASSGRTGGIVAAPSPPQSAISPEPRVQPSVTKDRRSYISSAELSTSNSSLGRWAPQAAAPVNTTGTDFVSPVVQNSVLASNSSEFLEDLATDILRFAPVYSIDDNQAIRAVAFHPSGSCIAVGSNSRQLRLCLMSSLTPSASSQSSSEAPRPEVLLRRPKHHKGSIYTLAWNNSGSLLASGSNDRSIKVVKLAQNFSVTNESEILVHSGTVRELCFVQENDSQIVSIGSGENNILLIDVITGQTVSTFRGHSGQVMTVHASSGELLVSGASDSTVRLWDLRSSRCVDIVMVGESIPASVCLANDSLYLASGQEDGSVLIYDTQAGRTLQSFRAHSKDCRSVRFSPDGNYLLTASYDGDINLVQNEPDAGQTVSPPSYTVASHKDKVIQARWHPDSYTFVSSSADKTATVWSTI